MKISELTLEEREEISRLLAVDLSFGDIGIKLDQDKSTISMEVSRLGMNRHTYRAIRAHHDALRKRKMQGRKNNQGSILALCHHHSPCVELSNSVFY